jgi:hypothetical protein
LLLCTCVDISLERHLHQSLKQEVAIDHGRLQHINLFESLHPLGMHLDFELFLLISGLLQAKLHQTVELGMWFCTATCLMRAIWHIMTQYICSD